MGNIVTLAKHSAPIAKYGSIDTDIHAVIQCNARGIRMNHLKEWNSRLLKSVQMGKKETCLSTLERELYPAHSGPWAIFEARGAKTTQFIEAKRYGITRVADLKMLGLSDFIGEMGFAFFIPVIPDAGNGQPSLTFQPDGENRVLVLANELVLAEKPLEASIGGNKIIAINKMPRSGRRLSDKDYGRLVGEAQSKESALNFNLSFIPGNSLLCRRVSYTYSGNITIDDIHYNEIEVDKRHNVYVGLMDAPLGLQGERTGAPARKPAEVIQKSLAELAAEPAGWGREMAAEAEVIQKPLAELANQAQALLPALKGKVDEHTLNVFRELVKRTLLFSP